MNPKIAENPMLISIPKFKAYMELREHMNPKIGIPYALLRESMLGSSKPTRIFAVQYGYLEVQGTYHTIVSAALSTPIGV